MPDIGKGTAVGRQFLQNLKSKATERNDGLDLSFVTVDSVSGDLVTVTTAYGGGSTRKVARSKGPTVNVGDRGMLITTQGGGMVFIPTGGVDHHPGIGDDSIQIGRSSSAEGTANITIGYQSHSAGTNGIAIGNGADAATGPNHIAIGVLSYASGTASTAYGYKASAVVGAATAIGPDASVTSWYGTAIGSGATSGSSGFAGGRLANAGNDGIAIGNGPTATGTGIAIGKSATANSNGIALGPGSVSGGADIVIGINASTAQGSNWGKIAIGHSATNNYERGFAIGRNAVTDNHDQGVLAVNHLKLVNSLGSAGSVISMHRTDGSRVYLRVNNSNVLTVSTS